jgi:phosphatidylglycerophosphate synthase
MYLIREKPGLSYKTAKAMETISGDRTRTNLLRKYEQQALAFLVQKIPSRVTSDMLSAVGLLGNIIVLLSFVLATYFSRSFLLLALPGFLINWFGDSLDGRLAYYRKKPRKLYGFTLDITIDWVGIILMGIGYIIYARGIWELLGYSFIVMYGWEIIISLMRFKITGKYSIDSGVLGPTEVRIVIAAILVAEVLFRDSIIYSSVIAVAIMLIVNIIDTRRLLQAADAMDIVEIKRKQFEQSY